MADTCLKLPMYGMFKRVFDKAYSRGDQLIAIGRDMAEVLEGKVARFQVSGSKCPKIIVIENWADLWASNRNRSQKAR